MVGASRARNAQDGRIAPIETGRNLALTLPLPPSPVRACSQSPPFTASQNSGRRSIRLYFRGPPGPMLLNPCPGVRMIRQLRGMNMRALLIAVIFLAMPFSARAGDPEFVPLSADTYMVVVKNHAGIFGNPQTTKMNAIKAANAFAAERGKIAVPLAMEYTPAGGPGHWPAAEYQFRLADKGSPGTTGTALVPRADVSIDVNTQPVAAAAPASPPSTKPDLYTELLKLDDLRKRGLLTNEEFDAAKRRLLEQ